MIVLLNLDFAWVEGDTYSKNKKKYLQLINNKNELFMLQSFM